MSLISGNAIFNSNSINCSSNSILGLTAFLGNATNLGDVASAVFNDGAVNCGSITSGVFLGSAINSGSVNVAEFFGTASNAGFVVESAKFADTSSNVGTVSGSAIFADTSISNGIVEGAVQLGVNVTEGENQALTETPTEYTQPDGFFPNAYYNNGGNKTYPPNYQIEVYQIGNFWYQYDVFGNGSLANGVFSDGVSVVNSGDYVMFNFVNGIKGSQKSIAKTINGTNYFYTGTIGNGTTLYTNAALTSLATSLALNAGDLNSDGISDFYVTNGQGQVTIEYGKQTSVGGYYYYGTIQNGTTLYTDQFITPASLGTSSAVGDNNNDGILEFVATTVQGVIWEVKGPEVVQLDGTDYYYRGSVINSNYEPALAAGYTLYTDQMLTTLAINKGDYLDIDNDGIYDHVTTDGSGTVSITSGQSTVLGATTYYHLGAFENGAVLYSDASLETLATGLSNVNVGDISDPTDGLDDCVSTNNLGIVSICYGSSAVYSICGYYYTGTFGVGNTLFSDSAATTIAQSLNLENFGDLSDPADNIDDYVSTDGAGIISISYGKTGAYSDGYWCGLVKCGPPVDEVYLAQDDSKAYVYSAYGEATDASTVSCILNWNNSCFLYYYNSLIEDRFIFTNSTLTCRASTVGFSDNNYGDFMNSDGITDFYNIVDGQLKLIEGKCICNLGYYTGNCQDPSTYYYAEACFQNVKNQGACYYNVDINGDGILDQVQLNDGKYVQTINGQVVLIDGICMYYLSALTFTCCGDDLVGVQLFSDANFECSVAQGCYTIGYGYNCLETNGGGCVVCVF